MTSLNPANNFVRELGKTAAKEPLATALIGTGLIWLLSSRVALADIGSGSHRAGRRAKSTVERGAESVRASAASATEKVQDIGTAAAEVISSSGREFADSAMQYLEKFPEASGRIADGIRENLAELFKAQPLALGAIGIAVGAAVAASLPDSTLESQYLGEASSQVKRKAADVFDEVKSDVIERGKRVADAVVEEASQQGLTADSLKSAAANLSAKTHVSGTR